MNNVVQKSSDSQRLHGWTYTEWQRFLHAHLWQLSRTHYRVACAAIWYAFNAGEDRKPTGRVTATTETFAKRSGLEFHTQRRECRQVERALFDLVLCGLLFPVDARYWQRPASKRGGQKRCPLLVLRPGSDEQIAAACLAALRFRGAADCFRLFTFLGRNLSSQSLPWNDPSKLGMPREAPHAQLSEQEIREFIFWCARNEWVQTKKTVTFPISASILQPLIERQQTNPVKPGKATVKPDLTGSIPSKCRDQSRHNDGIIPSTGRDSIPSQIPQALTNQAPAMVAVAPKVLEVKELSIEPNKVHTPLTAFAGAHTQSDNIKFTNMEQRKNDQKARFADWVRSHPTAAMANQ